MRRVGEMSGRGISIEIQDAAPTRDPLYSVVRVPVWADQTPSIGEMAGVLRTNRWQDAIERFAARHASGVRADCEHQGDKRQTNA